MPLCLQCSLPPNIHDWDLMFLQLMQCSTSQASTLTIFDHAGFMWEATMFPVELRSVLLVVGFTFVPLLLHFLLPVLLGFDNPKSELISLACQVMDSLLRFAEISSEVENHLHSANVNLIIYIISSYYILRISSRMPLLVKRPSYVSHMQLTCVTFHTELQGRTLNSNFALSQHCCQLCYGIWLKAACAFKELCAASCFRNSSTLPMSSSFWPPGVAFSTVGVLRRTRPLNALRIRSGSGSDAKWLSILLHIIFYKVFIYIVEAYTHCDQGKMM